ncbi:hypothetical protein Ddye_021015 [Dipteronia dyeriana]|uniref:Uncharacterized protein n=1 Tax=Dipteronia dyeriana TaxID=168575 RepID=A0AAD9U1U5_9ROSI|nr:hypothetical protein Ddye_021015 [Dipteronia dyeriana]
MIGTLEVRFSKVEFKLITRLQFGKLLDMSQYVSVDNGLHHRHFGGKDEISSLELRDVLRRETQEAKRHDKHMQDAYTIYGLSYAILSFAFEVIPELGTQFGTRVATDMSSQILK